MRCCNTEWRCEIGVVMLSQRHDEAGGSLSREVASHRVVKLHRDWLFEAVRYAVASSALAAGRFLVRVGAASGIGGVGSSSCTEASDR
jgi:hypothetical protein